MMNLFRKKTAVVGCMFLCLAAVVSCTLSLDSGDSDMGPSVSLTISNKTLTISLGGAGLFDFRLTEGPFQKAAQIPLFDDKPSDRPSSAAIELDISSVQAVPLAIPKSQTSSQFVTGTADILVRIADANSTNPCIDGIEIGTFRFSFADGVVTGETTSLNVPVEALMFLISGQFTICLELTATVDVSITIPDLDVNFGPPLDTPAGNGNDNSSDSECSTDADCLVTETCSGGRCRSVGSVLCGTSFDCELDEFCGGGVCEPIAEQMPCEGDFDCGLEEQCENGECVPMDDNRCIDDSDCQAGETCVSGQCEPDTSGNDNANDNGNDNDNQNDNGSAGQVVQIPIDDTGSALTPDATISGVDYALGSADGNSGMMEVASPDATAARWPNMVTVDLNQLGLANVQEIYYGTFSSFAPDLPGGLAVATLTCEYAEGGSPTTVDFTLGSNTAEWSIERSEHVTDFGGVPHSAPPSLFTFTTSIASAFSYTGHSFAGSLSLDSARTLTCIKLSLADGSPFASMRNPINATPTWLAQTMSGITLEGPTGTPAASGAGCTIECSSDADCASGEMCFNNQCVTAADCVADGMCNAACTVNDPDPDCAEICIADGFCNANCSDLDLDPDCTQVPVGQPRCTMSSSFDSGDEGWLILGDAQGGRGEPDFVASGGNPGGHVSADDDAQGGVWFFQAPASYRGNFSGALGRTLTFDLKQSSLSSQFDWIDISLSGGGLTIVVDAGSNPGTDWTHYSIALDTSAGWAINALSGTAATQADILTVLTDLDDIRIRGEYVSGRDTGGLDNVVLNSDCTTP